MNPEPPPIADPHSTAPLPSATEPRTFGTALLGLFLVAFGVFSFVVGVGLPAFLLSLVSRAPANLIRIGLTFIIIFGVILWGMGFLLVQRGLRIWKHGR